MKKPLYLLALLTATVGTFVATRPLDALTDTGVTMANIEASTLHNLRYDGDFYFQPTRLMRNTARRIPVDAQAAAVRALGRVVRTYVESEAFKQAYRQSMQELYPVDETFSDAHIAQREAEAGVVDEAVEQQTMALRQTMATLDPAMFYTLFKAQVPQLEAQAAAATGNERTQLMQQVANLKRMLAANTGKPAEFKKQYVAYQEQQLRQGGRQHLAHASQELAEAKTRNADYHQQKAALDAHSDFRPHLRQRLQAFVALCDEVDFSANVVGSGSRQEFISPVYQRKPATWKLLFRLGKVPVMAARGFAQEWLVSLT